MTNEEGKKKLNEFKDHIDTSLNIQRSIQEAHDPEVDGNLKAKARQLVAREGHTWYRETRDPAEPNAFPQFDPNNIQQYALAEAHARNYSKVRDEQANTTLRDNLGPMVGALSKKQLETMLNSDEGNPLRQIAQSAGKDYSDWLRLYQENTALGDVVGRAESGRLEDKDIAFLENRATNKRLEAVAKALDKRGIKDPLIRAETQNLVADTIRAEYTSDKDAYANAAKTLKGESDKKLKQYEEEKDKNLYGFVKAGFDNLRKSAPGSKAVRQLMYHAATAKE